MKNTDRWLVGYITQALQMLPNGIGGSMDFHSSAVIAIDEQMILTMSRIIYTRIRSINITLKLFCEFFTLWRHTDSNIWNYAWNSGQRNSLISWLTFVVVYVQLVDKLFNYQDWMKICHKVLFCVFVFYHGSLRIKLVLHAVIAPFLEVNMSSDNRMSKL